VTVPRRSLAPLLSFALAVAVLVGAMAPSAGAAVVSPAQDAPSVSVPHIIPQPNSGKKPEVEGDPGSTAQVLVFWGMCGALLVIGGLVALESRRKLRARDEAQTRSSTRSEPVADTSEKAPESSARR
jgi:hypothetical protein